MIRWTSLAPWEYEFPFPGSLTSTFLGDDGQHPLLVTSGLNPQFCDFIIIIDIADFATRMARYYERPMNFVCCQSGEGGNPVLRDQR